LERGENGIRARENDNQIASATIRLCTRAYPGCKLRFFKLGVARPLPNFYSSNTVSGTLHSTRVIFAKIVRFFCEDEDRTAEIIGRERKADILSSIFGENILSTFAT
jgi:hypothetical protein